MVSSNWFVCVSPRRATGVPEITVARRGCFLAAADAITTLSSASAEMYLLGTAASRRRDFRTHLLAMPRICSLVHLTALLALCGLPRF